MNWIIWNNYDVNLLFYLLLFHIINLKKKETNIIESLEKGLCTNI